MPPKRQRFIPFNPRVQPAANLVRRQQHTVGGDDGAPVRDPRLDAGAVQVAPGQSYALATEQQFADYTKVPAVYVLRFELGPDAFAQDSDSLNLRPEQFLLRRITWRVTPVIINAHSAGEPDFQFVAGPPIVPAYDPASCIEVHWEDEFSKFIGGSGPAPSGMLGAIFGEVNGFLDQTREILFAGKQTLSATVSRLVDLQTVADSVRLSTLVQGGNAADLDGVTLTPLPQIVEIEFHGIGLLPPGTNYSGGA